MHEPLKEAATAPSPVDKPHIDPVCGMRAATDPDKAFDHDGTTYYFCSQGCRTKFAGDAAHWLAHPPRPRPAAAPAAVPPCPSSGTRGDAAGDASIEYVCPMDPEIVEPKPGACPLCGMALEPRLPLAGDAGNAELDDMTRRLWVAAALTVPLWVIAMAPMVAGRTMPGAWMAWLQAALATPVVLWCGRPFFERAWVSFRTLRLNMFSLIGIGAGVSWGFSVVALLLPDLLPAAFREHGAAPSSAPSPLPSYFEAAAGITTLVLVGQVLELRARARTGGAIRTLLGLAPSVARRVDASGADVEVPLGDIVVGDRLRVRPGDRVPVDGVIESGRGAVDEALVTGESLPVDKAAGDRVVAGTTSTSAAFTMRADRIGADTLLARIASLVADAGRSRAPIQKLADRVAGWFVPLVLGIALVAALAWAQVGPPPVLAHALVAAVSVLIIACPCALGLATPISVTVAVGRGARDGVLIKDADALERLARVDLLVVDKTGTLTEGRASLTRIETVDGWAEDDVLRLVASLERGSAHPLAAAIVRAAGERGIALVDAGDAESLAGAGLKGRVEDRVVVVGNESLLAREGIAIDALVAAADGARHDGATALFVAVDGRAVAMIAVADAVRPSTAQALTDLRREGLEIVMLTGDHPTTAAAVARTLGIERFEAGVDPAGKQRFVRRLQAEGRRVAMAGDGINDAPALAAADVGIAIGSAGGSAIGSAVGTSAGGSDIAIESARVVLMRGDLAGLVKARRLARAALANIRQNLFFAFVYNALGVPVAAGVLYPLFGVLLSPTIAAAAMSFSSVSVISNALRLRNAKL